MEGEFSLSYKEYRRFRFTQGITRKRIELYRTDLRSLTQRCVTKMSKQSPRKYEDPPPYTIPPGKYKELHFVCLVIIEQDKTNGDRRDRGVSTPYYPRMCGLKLEGNGSFFSLEGGKWCPPIRVLF